MLDASKYIECINKINKLQECVPVRETVTEKETKENETLVISFGEILTFFSLR